MVNATSETLKKVQNYIRNTIKHNGHMKWMVYDNDDVKVIDIPQSVVKNRIIPYFDFIHVGMVDLPTKAKKLGLALFDTESKEYRLVYLREASGLQYTMV